MFAEPRHAARDARKSRGAIRARRRCTARLAGHAERSARAAAIAHGQARQPARLPPHFRPAEEREEHADECHQRCVCERGHVAAGLSVPGLRAGLGRAALLGDAIQWPRDCVLGRNGTEGRGGGRASAARRDRSARRRNSARRSIRGRVFRRRSGAWTSRCRCRRSGNPRWSSWTRRGCTAG